MAREVTPQTGEPAGPRIKAMAQLVLIVLCAFFAVAGVVTGDERAWLAFWSTLAAVVYLAGIPQKVLRSIREGPADVAD